MIDRPVHELAARQCGVFARFQLLELGLHPSTIKRRVASGTWIRLAPGVYGLPGRTDSGPRRLWVAYLTAGIDAVVSHESAAHDQRLPGWPEGPPTLTVPHPQHQRVTGAVVHQSRYLPRRHWLNLYGRRTTTVARTLVDLAASSSRTRLELGYEHAVLVGNLSHAAMAATFRELLRPGRRGMHKLAAVLDARSPRDVLPASDLERLLFDVCDRAGLTPVRQYPHPGPQVQAGCVDAALVEARLILEADGRRWHNRLADQARDRWRDKEAARAGWQTLRFCHEELSFTPEQEASTIREVYDRRCALVARGSS